MATKGKMERRPLNSMALYDSEDQEHDIVLKRKTRGYGGAMVSSSPGSQSSFRMPSPVRSPSRRHQREAPVASSDSSLDELIGSFRASASSLSFSTSRTGKAATSPVKKRPPAARLVSPKHKSILRKTPDPHHGSMSSDEEVAGVSPMPKLTYVPKPKPTLAIVAPKKPTQATSGLKPPSRFLQPRKLETASKPALQSKLQSPVKIPMHRPMKKAVLPPSPVASSLSNQSTTSSLMEEIDAPDSDDNNQDELEDHGEASIDDLIALDISKFNQLVSQSQEWPTVGTRRSQTSDDISRQLRQSTRFRRDRRDASDDDEEPSTRRSSFRLYSPTRGTSAVRLEPVRSVLHRSGLKTELDFVMDQGDEEHDSFAEELRTMKAAAVKEKNKKAAEEAQAKKKKADDEEQKKKASEAIGAGLSLRDCVDTIDKDLLLALRPFEKMKQELDKEEAKAAAAEAKANEDLDLPMATQSIVERLEQVFGGQTRQREAELKAEEDAAAAAKAAEGAKKKEEEDKKAAEEVARKQQEREILSLIPMHGRLMATQDDVYDALARLEYAETMAHESLHHRRVPHAPEDSIAREMETLRAFTMQRAREIEGSMNAGQSGGSVASRAVDWRRDAFGVDARDTEEADEAALSTEGTNDESTFPDVVRSEVVEQLEFTMLKLKHALSIDKKEAAEMEQSRKLAEAEAKRASLKKEEEKRAKERLDADAAAARQRVMGMASLEELTWVTEADARLKDSLHQGRALERLDESLTARMSNQQSHGRLPSFYDDSHAAERFDQVKLMMEAPYLLKVQQPTFTAAQQATQRRSPYIAQLTKNAAFWGSQAVDNQRFDAGDEEWVEIRQSPAEHQVRRPRSPRTYSPYDSPPPRRQVQVNDLNDNTERQRMTYSRLSPLSPPRDARTVSQMLRQRRDVDGKYTKTSPTRSHRSRTGEKLHELKRTMDQLQADRREKTHWFQASTRHR